MGQVQGLHLRQKCRSFLRRQRLYRFEFDSYIESHSTQLSGLLELKTFIGKNNLMKRVQMATWNNIGIPIVLLFFLSKQHY